MLVHVQGLLVPQDGHLPIQGISVAHELLERRHHHFALEHIALLCQLAQVLENHLLDLLCRSDGDVELLHGLGWQTLSLQCSLQSKHSRCG